MSRIVSDIMRARRKEVQPSAEEQILALKSIIEIGDYFGFPEKYEAVKNQLPADNLTTLLSYIKDLQGEESLPYVSKSRKQIGIWLERQLRLVELPGQTGADLSQPQSQETAGNAPYASSFISHDVEITDEQRLRLSTYISLIYRCDNAGLARALLSQKESFSPSDIDALLVCAVNKHNMCDEAPRPLRNVSGRPLDNVNLLCSLFFRIKPAWVDLACSRTTQPFPLDNVRPLDGVEESKKEAVGQAVKPLAERYSTTCSEVQKAYLEKLSRHQKAISTANLIGRAVEKPNKEKPEWRR